MFKFLIKGVDMYLRVVLIFGLGIVWLGFFMYV